MFDDLCLEGLNHYYQYGGMENGLETFICSFCGDVTYQHADSQP